MASRRPSSRWAIAIVGAGKVGTVLGRILHENGEKIVSVVSRSSSSARRAGRYLGCGNTSTSLAAIPERTQLIYITTPHGAVQKVAEELALQRHLNPRRLAVCHASGMLTAAVLDPLRRRGVKTFSFHPLQTFPRDFDTRDIVPTARGIYYGVDGTPSALRIAGVLARKLEGKTIVIPPELRTFYHAACVLASNHLTTMLSILERMAAVMRIRGKSFSAPFLPIIRATLENCARTSPAEALSGPVARGGVETIAEHFGAIRTHAPELMPYFLRMSMETVQLALAKGSLTTEQGRAMHALIASYAESESQTEVTP